MIYRVSRTKTSVQWHDVLVRVPGEEDNEEAKQKAYDAAEAFLDGLDEGTWDEAVNDRAEVKILDDHEPDYDDSDEIVWTVELAEDQTKEDLL